MITTAAQNVQLLIRLYAKWGLELKYNSCRLSDYNSKKVFSLCASFKYIPICIDTSTNGNILNDTFNFVRFPWDMIIQTYCLAQHTSIIN